MTTAERSPVVRQRSARPLGAAGRGPEGAGLSAAWLWIGVVVAWAAWSGHRALAQSPPAAVAALAAFHFDVNGDGTIDPVAEVFDLTLVAGGADGTLLFFRSSGGSAPLLLSVVRLPGPATSVRVDADQQIARVGLGARGVALVDLRGPASLQPIDLDRDGTDDRFLGLADTPAQAGATSDDLRPGITAVAEGPAGVTTVQVSPSRVRVIDLRRDPMLSTSRDETSILATRLAYSTDDAVVLTLESGYDTAVVLTVDEVPAGAVTDLVDLQDGQSSVAVLPGRSDTRLRIHPGALGRVTARVTAADGQVAAAVTFSVVPAPGVTSALVGLEVAPSVIGLTLFEPTSRLSVGARYDGGRYRNVTRASDGTTYAVANAAVAGVSPDGVISARAGGQTVVLVGHGGLQRQVVVTVSAPEAVQALQQQQPAITLTRLGQTAPVQVFALLSSGERRRASADLAAFTSSDPSVATVDADGNVSAVGAGLADIVVRAGAAERRVTVLVEPRVTPDITSFTLDPVSVPVPSDLGMVTVTGRAAGTGSLSAVPVTLTVAGRTFVQPTAYDGVVKFAVQGLATPGEVTAIASLMNPANGAMLAASTSLLVVRQGTDAEPNDTLDGAVPVQVRPVRIPVAGRVGGGDARDAFRLPLATAGMLSVAVRLGAGGDASGVLVRVLRGDGSEIARSLPSGNAARVRAAVARGDTYVEIAGGTSAVEYELVLDVEQAPIAVSQVTPASGGPGTVITIDGAGFDATPGATQAYVGGVRAAVQAVSETRVVAVVPALAVDGPVRVISGSRRAESAPFTVGRPGPPQLTLRPERPGALRLDPVDGTPVDVSRVAVVARPDVDPAGMEALASSLAGTVAGINAVVGCYFLDFPGHRGLEDLERTRANLAADPRVTAVHLQRPATLAAGPRIDATSVNFAHPWAFDGVRAYAALSLVRRTPPFDDAGNLAQVTVAVIDSGFEPANMADYTTETGVEVVTYFDLDAAGRYVESPRADPNGHGTAVASIIGALNDGTSPLTGVLGGLYSTRENPAPLVRVFGASHADNVLISPGKALHALAVIAQMGDVDAVNLSFGSEHVTTAAAESAAEGYALGVDAVAGRTLVVIAAGNDGIAAANFAPARLSLSRAHVVTVGATAVVNGDGTGEVGDVRAVFGGRIRNDLLPVACDSGNPLDGSNCGTAVSIAAAGEDFQVSSPPCNPAPISLVPCTLQQVPGVVAGGGKRGTSFAAPLVTGTAGLLKAIAATLSTPTSLKAAILDTADDISEDWNPGSMTRLNVLSAVLPHLPARLLPQRIFVADEDATDTSTAGALIGLDAQTDSVQVNQEPALVQPIQATIRGQQFVGRAPTSMVMSPVGGEAYVLVRSISPDLGDGVLVFDTLFERVVDFVALSGATLDSGPDGFTPVIAPDARVPMAVSPDARLLYVAVGLRLIVVNLVDRLVVRSFADLPVPYDALAADYPAGEFETRLAALVTAANQSGPPATQFSALSMLSDGSELYIAVQAGRGQGLQPGRMLGVNVGLYADAEPQTGDLQSDLSAYMTPLGVTAMGGSGSEAGDEPSAIAADARFNRVYLVNGGVDGYTIIPATPDEWSLTLEIDRLFGTVDLDALQELTDVGGTLIRARGFTGVFDINPATPVQEFAFPSEVNFGWNSSARLVTQFNLPQVFAKRPMGIALRPDDSSRGLVSFFQTGNFGVLDMNAGNYFATPPADGVAVPAITNLSGDQFPALAGVTASVPLDSHLWPKRGRLPLGGDNYVPSPDEALLFGGPITYAQNGRFAVASHAGTGRSTNITYTMPLVPSVELLGALDDLGLSFSPNATITLNRKGGAITIVDSDAIDQALGRASVSIPTARGPRPALAVSPVCAYDNAAPARCTGAVTRPLFSYAREGGTVTRFEKPRGVGVQPFVYVDRPRFGDHVTASTPVQVEWRDPEVTQVVVKVVDLDATPQEVVGDLTVNLTEDERSSQAATRGFRSLFKFGKKPSPGRRYRINAALRKSAASRLASVDVEVVFDDVGDRLRLTPELSFVTTVPGGTVPLDVRLQKLDGTSLDVTGDAVYSVLGQGLTGADVPGLQQALSSVGQALGLASGTVPIAKVQISPSGVLTAQTPGIQVVRASLFEATAPSNLAIVLVGFDLEAFTLEPRTPSSAAPSIVDELQMVERNTPMLLGALSGSVVRQDGLVAVHQVFFSFGGGTVTASELFQLASLGDGSTTPVASDTDVVDWMLVAAESLSADTAMAFTPRDPEVASLACPFGTTNPAPWAACVRSGASGLGLVGGRLDLTSIGLSARNDDLLVFVVPDLQSAEFEPRPPVISRSTPPPAGPTVRTMACLGPADGDFSLPAGYADAGEFRDAWLPTGWPSGGAPVAISHADGFTYSVTARLDTGTVSLSYALDRLCLAVPTDPTPGVTNQGLQQTGTQLVNVTRVDGYTSRLEHLGVVGGTTLSHTVGLDGLGTATATAPLAVCCPPSDLGGFPIITELNLTPRRDWNDSAGGNGTPFDHVPGNGTVDQDDAWVEIAGGTSPIANWQVRLTDEGGATFSKALGPPTTSSQTRLLTEWGLGTSPVVLVEVVDQAGLVRVSLDIRAIEQVIGPATGPGDETLTWSVFGTPSPLLQQLLRRPATINLFAPF